MALQETLRQRRCVLRVRIESGKSLLTFKGPVQRSPVKAREEVETVVGDGTSLLCCFEQLGYRVWFRYQKYREEYSLGDVVLGDWSSRDGVAALLARAAY